MKSLVIHDPLKIYTLSAPLTLIRLKQIIIYNFFSKNAPTFREGMNYERIVHQKRQYVWIIPTGIGEFKPDKPDKKGVRWNKTFGRHDKGTIGEAGASSVLTWRGCQRSPCPEKDFNEDAGNPHLKKLLSRRAH